MWEVGVVSEEYVEARLNELTDLCYRKMIPTVAFIVGGERLEHRVHFANKLTSLMSQSNRIRYDADLAHHTRLPISTIRALKSRQIDPDLTTIRRISDALGVEPAELIASPASRSGAQNGQEEEDQERAERS